MLSVLMHWSSSPNDNCHCIVNLRIVQWSPRSPQSFDSIQNNLSMIAKRSDLSKSAQWFLSDLSIFPPRSRDSWEINECTRISPRNSFFVAFERLLRDQAYFWLLNGSPTISVLCKGPHTRWKGDGRMRFMVYLCVLTDFVISGGGLLSE